MSEASVREELIKISKEIVFASYNSGCFFYENGSSVSVELGALSYDQLVCPKSLRFWTLLGMLPESVKVRVSLEIPAKQIETDSLTKAADPRFESVLDLLAPIKNLVSLNISSFQAHRAFSVDTSPLSNHVNLCKLCSGPQISLTPLRDLPLTCLEVNVSAQEDLSPISGMTMLKTLCIGETRSSDCSFLRNLPELKELTILVKPFYLSNLVNLTSLESFRAYDVKFDLDSLRLKRVKTLYISDSSFEGCNLAKCFPAVQNVFLYNTALESPIDICELPSLRKMELTDSSLSMNWRE